MHNERELLADDAPKRATPARTDRVGHGVDGPSAGGEANHHARGEQLEPYGQRHEGSVFSVDQDRAADQWALALKWLSCGGCLHRIYTNLVIWRASPEPGCAQAGVRACR